MTRPNSVSSPKTPRIRCSEVSGRRSQSPTAVPARPIACAGRRRGSRPCGSRRREPGRPSRCDRSRRRRTGSLRVGGRAGSGGGRWSSEPVEREPRTLRWARRPRTGRASPPAGCGRTADPRAPGAGGGHRCPGSSAPRRRTRGRARRSRRTGPSTPRPARAARRRRAGRGRRARRTAVLIGPSSTRDDLDDREIGACRASAADDLAHGRCRSPPRPAAGRRAVPPARPPWRP